MAQTGAVTLIQRFGSTLNLDIHFHMLFPDSVYIGGDDKSPSRFFWVKAPTSDELTALAHTIKEVDPGLLCAATQRIFLVVHSVGYTPRA